MTTELKRDRSTGRVHAAIDGRTFEADNADDAGDYDVIQPEDLADVPRDQLCRRCFPTFADRDDPDRDDGIVVIDDDGEP